MRIDRIDAFQVQWRPEDPPSARSAFLRVWSDDGRCGLGEASPMQGGLASLVILKHHIGPAIIGARARLTDCYVGPYTAIGEDCVICEAEVEHSILLAGCTVRHLEGRMESSLLGRNVTISRGVRQPKAYRFMVGDNSEIGIL